MCRATLLLCRRRGGHPAADRKGGSLEGDRTGASAASDISLRAGDRGGAGPHGSKTQPDYPNLAAIPRAILCAAPSIVTIGFTPRPVGSTAPSTTYRPRTSQASPSESQTEFSRELPMRAVPIRWNEPSVTWAGPQPQRSAASSSVAAAVAVPGS